jgi:uncharacterized protein (TIGR01244 family)
MAIAYLSETYAVSEQIEAGDMADLAAEGFACVICNRPDAEVPPDRASAAMAAAAEAAGLIYKVNPVAGGAMTLEHVDCQSEIMEQSEGKVLAYCASGTRSTVLWAFAQAGNVPTADILTAARSAGRPIDGLAPQLEALARSRDG